MSNAAASVLRELIAQFPDAPALTLAKKAYREHPELWPSLEACRTAIRTRLGVQGERARKHTADKSKFRSPRKAGWSDVIPEALQQLGDWKAFEIEGPHRALILSDIHIPFHDASALALALQYGMDRKATLIVLNGDVLDHFAMSKYEKNPKLRDFPSEVKAAKFFMSGLRKAFPKTRIIFKHGNHEERYEAYMRFKCVDFLGVPDFEWENVFSLKDYGIELVTHKRPIRLGKLHILHGHEYVFAISNPVNPARGLHTRAKVHALCGHFHQGSEHTEKNLEQKLVTCWSTGALCNMHPEWMPLNKWGHGFAFVEIDKAGAFQVSNLRIIDGKVY